MVVVRVIAIIYLSMLLGGASVYFGFFPGQLLADAFSGLTALKSQLQQRAAPYNLGAAFPVFAPEEGVLIWDKARASEGYTIYTTGHGTEVKLIGMDGQLVHSWTASYLDLWDETDEVQDLLPERFIFIRKARVQPDGSLLLMFAGWSATPYGYGIAKLDKDSKLIWKQFVSLHHSFDQADDGTIYALNHRIVTEARQDIPGVKPPFIDDGVTLISPDGAIVDKFSLLDAFVDSAYGDVIPQLIAANTGHSLGTSLPGLGDLLHANDVEVLSAAMADKFPMAGTGDILVSMREIDGVAIIDAESKKVKWFRRGSWHRQHDADFLANGNLMLFDNLDLQYGEDGLRASRIVEFDPATLEEKWVYRGRAGERFRSAARGSQQRLENGNTLITESHRFRLFEVTPAGDIVWEYRLGQRIPGHDDVSPVIMWAKRYAPDALRFDMNGGADRNY